MAEEFLLMTGDTIARLQRFLECLVKMETLTKTVEQAGRKNNDMLKDPIMTATIEQMQRIRTALERIRIAFDEEAGKRLEAAIGIENVENIISKAINGLRG